MQSLSYLWVATLVVWIGTIVYLMAIIRKQNRLDKEIQGLQKMLDEFHQS